MLDNTLLHFGTPLVMEPHQYFDIPSVVEVWNPTACIRCKEESDLPTYGLPTLSFWGRKDGYSDS